MNENMRRTGQLTAILLGTVLLLPSAAQARKPETFEQAKAISVQRQKPILLEFYRDD